MSKLSKNWIRAARQEAGLTQGQLADKLGIDNSAISYIETGRHTPSVPTLFRIAALLGNESLVEALAAFVSSDGGTLYKDPRSNDAA